MNLQGRVSQGIPIGNDLSYLLAEVVLSNADRALGADRDSAFRWYDDYEVACSSRGEAEQTLATLTRELGKFRLRLNLAKTSIEPLPLPAEDEWRDALLDAGRRPLNTARELVQFFDCAFRLRETHPHAPVLLYALGVLFRLRRPQGNAEKVALSCITQALLAEPGVAQKAFALLSFWEINGWGFDRAPVAAAIAQMVANHQATGLSSDIAWALFFCMEATIELDRKTARQLSEFQDDVIAIQACDMDANGLFRSGFSKSRLTRPLTTEDPDGEHWLAAYELVRQRHCANPGVTSHPVLGEMLRRDVPFYRTRPQLPRYASLLHPGGAPEWAVNALLRAAEKKKPPKTASAFVKKSPVVAMIEADVSKLPAETRTRDDLVAELFGGDFKRLIATVRHEQY